MSLSLADWHERFMQQAGWTQTLRQYVLNAVNVQRGDSLLEVGSGTGAILANLSSMGNFHLTGIDIDHPSLVHSKLLDSSLNHTQADGHMLPFPKDTFSASLCHYLLLWVQNPLQILKEMLRVTRPGGGVICLAEPDHQARIDYPAPLDHLGALQTQTLQEQGVDTAMGRQLRLLFNHAGLQSIETGIIGAQWAEKQSHTVDQIEWSVLRSDLADKLSEEEISTYHDVEKKTRQAGARVLFIPTFYAFGLVPK